MLAREGRLMRVLCTLREIQEELGLTTAELQRELVMDARTIEKLIADTDSDSWRLNREALHRLVLFAHSHGFDAFRIEPDKIWRNFENSEAIILRGPKKADIPVESHLVRYFESLNCEVTSSIASSDIEETMKHHNCVIIGSPSANPACEVGLALLWRAEPFNGEPENCNKIPVSFLGMRTERKGPSALLQESTRHGLQIRSPGSRERRYLKVDWLPPEKYAPSTVSGQDAAVLVVCHQPIGTQENVTTIVIAGYTGLATLVAAQEVTHKTIPELRPEETPGQPSLAALKFRYKKRRKHRALNHLRTLEEGSVTWAPPWQEFF